MANSCGAKTRDGDPCKKPPMHGRTRCMMHGGKTKPNHPPFTAGNAVAAKPGSLYSQFLTQEEQIAFDAIRLGDVNAELRLMRIRLARALAAETNQPELESTVEREGGGAAFARVERTYKQRDYVSLIDKITSRIESLERTRIALRGENGDDEDSPTSDDLTHGSPDEPGPT